MSRITLTLAVTTITVSGGRATATASVTNRAKVPDRIVLGAFAPADVAKEFSKASTWTTIDKPLREISAGATEQYAITFTPPDGAAAGSYPVRFIAYSADAAPEENADQARQVEVVIPSAPVAAPVKKQRWPVAVMAALVLVVVAVAVYVLWPRPTDGGGGEPTVTVSLPSITAAVLPDLVVSDIVLNEVADGNGDVVVSVVVQNRGASTSQGFEVACECECKSFPGSPVYFSPGKLPNGLGGGQQATVGGDSLLSLSGCPIATQRKFTCTVDPGKVVDEADESNNSLAKVLLTGR